MEKEFNNILANFMLNEVKATMNKYKISVDEVFEIVSTDELCKILELYHQDKITKYTLKDVWNTHFKIHFQK